ncbi:hypothetical protein GCM10010254_67990 [Streptomyces chromofuscus]|nr:hypothetical protein GCM10010254_67990 [Streptomyces chromofuscus]
MLMADPPRHTRLRRLVSGAFTPGAVDALAPRIEQLAHQYVDAFASAREADLATVYTGPLPMAVICELLGVPAERRGDLQSWTRAAMTNPSDRQRASLLALNTYLRERLEEKRRRPQDDLLSRLIAVRDEVDGQLSDTELLGTAVILMAAGHETTVNLLGNALVALPDHPEQARELRLFPERIPDTVEEFLRYDAPVEHSPTRFATERLTLGGAVAEAGDTVTVALTSAGRDAPVGAGYAPNPAGRPAEPRPPRVLRPRHPLLHRGPARPRGDGDRAAGPADPPAGDGLGPAGGGRHLAARGHHPGAGTPACHVHAGRGCRGFGRGLIWPALARYDQAGSLCVAPTP